MILPLKYRIAAEALARWQNAVRPFAADEHLRWQQLLGRLPDDVSSDVLRASLAALAAKNEKEQRRFLEFFEEAAAVVGAIGEAEIEPFLDEKVTEKAEKGRGAGFFEKYGWLVWPLILAVGGLVFGYLHFQKKEKPTVKIEMPVSVAAGHSRVVCLDSSTIKQYGKIDSASFQELPEIVEGHKTVSVPLPIEAEKATVFGKYGIQQNGCLEIESAEKDGRDTVVVFANSIKGERLEIHFFIEIIELKSVASGEKPQPKYLFEPHPIPFDHTDLLKKLALEPPTKWQKLLAEHPFLVKTGLLGLLALGLLGWLFWRAAKRRRLVADRERSEKPPYIWHIRIRDLPPPDAGEAFQTALHSMRRRTDDAGRLLDLKATIGATIRRGGMTDFRFRQQTRPPEYLFLIDRHDGRDHRARLYDDLHRLFEANDVLTDRYFFDGDINLCFNENWPDGIGLDELLHRHAAARLLVISHGRRMVSPTTGRLARWTDRFKMWKDRALLTPLPASEWSRRERQLGELFSLAPASVEGIRHVVEAFEADEDAPALDFSKLAALGHGEPILFEKGLLETLEKAFPDRLDRVWLAACALWPELHYDLTVWLGHWLANDLVQPICSVRRLGGLLRLPWFAAGSMPPEAQTELLAWLEREAPGLRERLHRAIHALLEQPENRPPENSAAWDDFAMRVAFNEWKGATDPRRRRELEEEIARLLKRGVEPDFVVVKELLEGEKGRMPLPESWEKQLFRGGYRGLGLNEGLRDLVLSFYFLLLGSLAMLIWQPPKIAGCGETPVIVQFGKDSIFVCPEDGAKRLLLFEYFGQKAADERAQINFDSLVAESYSFQFYTTLDSSLLVDTATITARQVFENASVAAFNTGVFYYQNWERDGHVQSQKDSACMWFRLATHTYLKNALAFVKRAESWCAGDTAAAARLDIRPSIEGFVFDAQTRQPIDGASVTATPGFSVKTDGKGQFLLKNMAAKKVGAVRLEVSKDGFEGFSRVVSIEGLGRLGDVFLRKVAVVTPVSPPFEVKKDTPPRIAPPPVATVEIEKPSEKVLKVLEGEFLVRFDTPVEGVPPMMKGGSKRCEGTVMSGLIDGKITIGDKVLFRATPGPFGSLQAGINEISIPTFKGDFEPVSIQFGDESEYLSKGYVFKVKVKSSENEKPADIPLPDMVFVKGGQFQMGCDEKRDGDCKDNEKPVHKVEVFDFYISKTEVTQALWRAVMGNNPSEFKGCDECPVEQVSWDDVQNFLQKLNEATGKTYRLPTEAEWEYAARGGQESKRFKYAGSNDLNLVAWHFYNSQGKTHPVAGKNANELGLFDMSGNVWEWCEDDWHPNYKKAPTTATAWTRGGNTRLRVLRGGNYILLGTSNAWRNSSNRDDKINNCGFRLARSF